MVFLLVAVCVFLPHAYVSRGGKCENAYLLCAGGNQRVGARCERCARRYYVVDKQKVLAVYPLRVDGAEYSLYIVFALRWSEVGLRGIVHHAPQHFFVNGYPRNFGYSQSYHKALVVSPAAFPFAGKGHQAQWRRYLGKIPWL